MSEACGLKEAINSHLQLNTQGWCDDDLQSAIMLLNISGEDSLEDIDRLKADEGLKTLLHHRTCEGMSRKEKRAYKLRFRKSK